MNDFIEITTGDDDVDHLIGATRLLELKIKTLKKPEPLPPWFKAVEVSGNFGSICCLIDDEYDDIDGINHPRALQALLLTAFDYFDADNNDVWYQNNDIDGNCEDIDDLLGGLKGFWKIYQAHIKNPEQIINPYPWQINEGSAQILRNLVNDKAITPENKEKSNGGFRVDIQRIIFSFLLFFSGIIFVKLVEWTSLEIFGYGTIVTSLVALYYFFTAFSKITKD